jgi:hypothetical protein
MEIDVFVREVNFTKDYGIVLSIREVEEQAKKELQSVFAFAPKVLVKEKRYFRRIRPEVRIEKSRVEQEVYAKEGISKVILGSKPKRMFRICPKCRDQIPVDWLESGGVKKKKREKKKSRRIKWLK